MKDLEHEKVFHTFSIILDEPDHGDIWMEASQAKLEGGSLFNDWDRLLGKYTVRFLPAFGTLILLNEMLTSAKAVTDVPRAIFWKQLIEAFILHWTSDSSAYSSCHTVSTVS